MTNNTRGPVMNKFPIIEMLALYSRYHRIDKPVWRPDYTRHLKRVRSCHSRTDGGIRKLFYSIETTSGEIFDLNYNEEDVTWALQPGSASARHVIDRVLARILRHKHTHSRAHRIVPYRFAADLAGAAISVSVGDHSVHPGHRYCNPSPGKCNGNQASALCRSDRSETVFPSGSHSRPGRLAADAGGG